MADRLAAFAHPGIVEICSLAVGAPATRGCCMRLYEPCIAVLFRLDRAQLGHEGPVSLLSPPVSHLLTFTRPPASFGEQTMTGYTLHNVENRLMVQKSLEQSLGTLSHASPEDNITVEQPSDSDFKETPASVHKYLVSLEQKLRQLEKARLH